MNNVAAYAVGGTVAIVIGYVVARKHNARTGIVDVAARIVLVLAVAMLLTGLAWYFYWHRNFIDHAHFVSAIGLFAVVGVVMVLNALEREKNSRPLRIFYGGAAGFMVVGALATVAVKRYVVKDWQHQVLMLELVEMAAFLVYWVVQTIQHWDEGIKGVPAPADDV